MPDTAVTALGHNHPPSDIDLLRERLAEQTAHLGDAAAPLFEVLARWDAERPEIADEEQAKAATNLVQRFKRHADTIEAAFKPAKAPALAMGRAIDDFFNGLRAPVRDAITRMEGKINAFQRRIADQRRKADEAERAEAAKRQEPPPPPKAAAPVQIRSDHGAMAIERKVYRVEIQDITTVPAEYLLLDEKKALAVLKAGVAIPGLRLITDTKIVVR